MKVFLLITAFLILFIISSFLIASKIIGDDVKRQCKIAQEKYPGECVSSLIAFVDDNNNNYKSRNSAIWALGQLGDQRSLKVLKKYYTGNIADKEPLDKVMSQHELKKAINLVNGGFNLIRFVKW